MLSFIHRLVIFCPLWVLAFEARWFATLLWGAALLCSNCWTLTVPALDVFEVSPFAVFSGFPLNATLFASQAPPVRMIDGRREMRNNGPVLMTDPFPISIGYRAKTKRKCRYSEINHGHTKSTTSKRIVLFEGIFSLKPQQDRLSISLNICFKLWFCWPSLDALVLNSL